MSGELEIRDLSVRLSGREVLKRISVGPVGPGQILAVIGPNGAGKSTAIRALAGLLPAQGRISLGGRDLSRLSRMDHALSIGFVPQHLASRSTLPVIDSMVAALSAGGIARDDRQAVNMAHAALDRLSLLPLALRPLHRLSGGEAQMVALALATAHEPPLLLLDEPASGLDPARIWMLGRALEDRRRRGGLTVIVLHDLGLALDWADRVLVLKEGCVLAEGDTAAVMTASLLADAFGIHARLVPVEGRTVVQVTGLRGSPAET